jgi:uncharacterized RDD family membrane protein YckC
VAVQLGRLEVETSDHVVLRYDLAGGGNRGFAAVVDFLIATLVFVGGVWFSTILVRGLGLIGFQLQGVLLLVMFLVAWSYFVVLEWLWQGQTVGKRMYGLRVIREDGAPVGFIASLIRNLLRMVDFLPLFYGVGLVSVIVTTRSQRLGDIAAGTYVVRAPKPQLDYFSLRTTTPLGAGATVELRGLSGEAQRLVREFVAREGKLSAADRARVAQQIARHVRPYARDISTLSDDVEFLRAVARSLRASGGER